ncbi:hypothetical protein OG792_32850 [Micromonospora sp. NBC_01699]|uniref:hypothetical protein n=1 Tax=Micromonospora sp. NBC_01699 TaxID=2975984 RepID=UPI002E2B4E32|nr:hypothetical protein [Micromonospora sp. NBC_01699]
MRDGEWTLSYPGTSITWGTAASPIVNMSAPALGDAALRADDDDRPRSDGRGFGVDFRGGTTISFDLGVFGPDEATARRTVAELARAWRADAVRTVPGAVAELRVRYAGRERVTYGRPRRFAVIETYAADGIFAVVADFDTVDDLWYSPEDNWRTVTLAPPAGGGLTGLLASPLTTTGNSDRSIGVTIGGELPAWSVLEVHGPITNPVVEIVGLWRVELNTTIAYDRTVWVDTRPWRRLVEINGGGSLAGSLTRGSVRLGASAIPPGPYELALRGTDETGTAFLRFAWRETFTTP